MSNPIEDQLLFHIGWMADSFARLESRIVDCFALLVNPGKRRVVELISDRLSLNQTVNLIAAILKDSKDAIRWREFATLANEIEKAAVIRNDLLHSSWSTPSANDSIGCDIIQERARKRHKGLTGHSLDDLLLKIHDGTLFIQEVEKKVVVFVHNL